MQFTSARNISFLLVAIFSLGLAGLSIAAPASGDGGLLREADTNADNAISKEEFDAKRSDRFSDANIDGTGGLTFDEFKAMNEKREEERRDRRAQHQFDRLDTNDDGVIDAAELAVKTDRMFDHMDANEDGVLSVDELKKGHHGRMRGSHRGGHGGCQGDGTGYHGQPKAAPQDAQ